MISQQEDGAYAIVDIDTLWRDRATGDSMHWKGRACNGNTKVGDSWYLIFHTGLLEYKKCHAAADALASNRII